MVFAPLEVDCLDESSGTNKPANARQENKDLREKKKKSFQ